MNALNARHVLAVAMGLIGIGSIVHCSSSAFDPMASTGPELGDAATRGDAVADFAADAGINGGALFPGALDSSRGLILVHGSPNLPAFRLCFGTLSPTGYLEGSSKSIRPLPDRELMPDSNVVGVEIGSAVRLKPLNEPQIGVDATAHAFAFPEVFVRPGGGTDLPCSARICPTSSSGTCLPKDPVPGQRGFYDLGPLPAGATEENVQLLAIHGCVPGSADGGAGASSCGAGYDPLVGNLKLDLLPLTAYKTEKPEQFFVQVAQLSGAVVGGPLHVRYGELGNSATLSDLALSADFGDLAPAGTPRIFDLDRTAPGIYASRGFEITVGSQKFTQSLAQIQLATAPQALPDDLYSAKSNFVLLLLGDPALSDANGNALSPMTDPGLLVHLLVVPVRQQADSDAGPEIPDAGGGG
ncbi:MAG: hypothetical protein ABIP39_14340 [Polyangiaceae bacterium]